jgi:hypothetical protein
MLNSTVSNSLCDMQSYREGRSTAQAVSCRLPTTTAQVRSRVWLSGICGGQSGTGVALL